MKRRKLYFICFSFLLQREEEGKKGRRQGEGGSEERKSSRRNGRRNFPSVQLATFTWYERYGSSSGTGPLAIGHRDVPCENSACHFFVLAVHPPGSQSCAINISCRTKRLTNGCFIHILSLETVGWKCAFVLTFVKDF